MYSPFFYFFIFCLVEKQNTVQNSVNQKLGVMAIDGGVLKEHTVAILLIQRLHLLLQLLLLLL